MAKLRNQTHVRPSTDYTAELLAELAAIIERAAPRTTVDQEQLRTRLVDLLTVVGRADEGSIRARAFREAVDALPGHKELADRYRVIAASDDPLNPEHFRGVIVAEMTARAERKWRRRSQKLRINRPHLLLGVPSDMLTEAELGDVKSFALEIARYHDSFVQPGSPRKTVQDTLLAELADIYLELGEMSLGRWYLNHHPNSRFIRFTRLALEPFFELTEVSPGALSQRWRRMKKEARRKPGREKTNWPAPAAKPLLRRRKIPH